MTSTRPVQVTYSSGEIDPLLHQRNDFQRWQTGMAIARGFIPLRQGGIARAPGTIFRGTTRNNQLAVRIPFEFARNDTLALEFTHLKMRVWRYGALVQDGGGVFELDTPFEEADLFNLDWVQDNDLVYIVDGRHPMQKLARLALNSWTIGDLTLEAGPFRVQNLDEAKTVQCSSATGTITLSAVGDVFEAGHVGALMQIKPTDYNDIPFWVGNVSANIGDLVRNEGKIYKLVNGNNTGINKPVHEFGKVRADHGSATKWEYLSDETGIVRITAVTDANTATAEVVKRVPQPAVGDPTYRWSFGAWNEIYGYPSRLARYKRRLYAANSATEPRTIWASSIGDFTNHEPSDEADGAFAYEIDGQGSRNEITWLAGGQRGIYIGALGEVYRGFSSAAGEAIGPLTFDTEMVDSSGSTRHNPVLPYGFPIYISIDKSRIQETRYSFEDDGSAPVELTLPSQHLGNEFFEQIVWQSAPEKFGWARRASGDLVAMIYDPKQDVLGWAPVPLAGGYLEHMDITVSADGAYDVLTLIVRREIDGQTVRYVEEQVVNRNALLGAVSEVHFNHAMASVTFEPAEPSAVFSVSHLAGETVWAWTDKGQFGPLIVAGNGDVTLPEEVGRAIIGLADDDHRARSLPITAAGRDGDTRGRPRRVHSGVGVGLFKTAAGAISVVEKSFANGEAVGFSQEMVPRGVGLDILSARSGIASVDIPSGHANEVCLEFLPVGIAPMAITALIPQVEEAGP